MSADLRARIAAKLLNACPHFSDDPECAELTADAVLAEPLVAEFIASLDRRCSCDGDPIECNHEAARGQAEALLSAAQTSAKAALDAKDARIAELEAELKDASDAYWREREQHEADRLAKDTEIGRLRRELAEANRRYEERTPTQWAYEQACHALEKHRERADAAEAEVKRLTDLNAQYADRAVENGQRAERAEADLARSKDVAIREAEQVRSERNRYAERAEQAEALADEHAANARELGERLRQAEAERDLKSEALGAAAIVITDLAAQRDRLRAADGRVRAALAKWDEDTVHDTDALGFLLDDLRAALDRAPAAEPDDYAARLSPTRVVSVAANSIGYTIQQVCHLDLHVDAVTAAAQRLYDQGLLKTPADQAPATEPDGGGE